MIRRSRTAIILFSLTLAAPAGRALADDSPSAIESYFDDWFDRVDQTQAEQPHWMTPLVTVTPRLEEEFRYDQNWETLPHGAGSLDSFGGGKGLELIPTEQTEIILGVPPYEERFGRDPHEGLADMPLLLKYRLLSANEEQGNYILTVFLQGGAPVGDRVFGSHHYAIGPTLAFGAGWGDFDIQTTLGETFPTGQIGKLGSPIALNTAFQYHVSKVFWPEFEVNYMYWPNGERVGKSQVYLTPGLVIGRIPVTGRLRLAVGLGYQFALSPNSPLYEHDWVLSVRTPF